MPLLSRSLLSADTDVFDPFDPRFPARWRCPYIYVQYGTCLVVYVYVRLLLACGPGLLSRSTTQYQSLEPSLHSPTHQPLTESTPTLTHLTPIPHTCCFYMKIHSAVVLPYSFQNAAWHISCFYCMGVRVCRVCASVFCVYVYGAGTNLPICRLGLI